MVLVFKLAGSCKGICIRYKPRWKTGTPRYTDESCRCSTCETWLETATGTTNFRCNCCNVLVTTRPKIKLVARRRYQENP